jgi:hypothetical protein
VLTVLNPISFWVEVDLNEISIISKTLKTKETCVPLPLVKYSKFTQVEGCKLSI